VQRLRFDRMRRKNKDATHKRGNERNE
jgi:hypothetical protein